MDLSEHPIDFQGHELPPSKSTPEQRMTPQRTPSSASEGGTGKLRRVDSERKALVSLIQNDFR